ncbi:hypothetical protein J4423_05305 [Candidatus Pacearchaeota archaeon]|nr:hypothetical protein [Candidatus Pacearchaeota archaeon]
MVGNDYRSSFIVKGNGSTVMGVLAVITDYNDWLIAIAVLVIGITKLMRNYKK